MINAALISRRRRGRARYRITADDYTPSAGATVVITAQLLLANGTTDATAGRIVTWTEFGGSGDLDAATSTTDASGVATVNFTPPSAGAYSIRGTDDVGVTGISAAIVAQAPAWVRLVHALAQTADFNNPSVATTDTRDTTGADLIVLAVTYGSAITVSDSESNDWTSLTDFGGTPGMRFFYCHNPTTSATHTFTVSGAFAGCSIAMAAYSGSAADPFDQENGTSATAATVQPGSAAPTQSHELVVTACAVPSAPRTPFSIDSDFGITDSADANSFARGIALADLLDTGSAQNPTWSVTGSGAITAVIATFRSQAGAPPPATHYAVTADNDSPIAGTVVTITAQRKKADESDDTTAGAVVTWSHTGGGSFSSSTSTTNASGTATVDLTTSASVDDVETVTATDAASLTGTSETITTQDPPVGGANEPAGNVMIVNFDPSDARGLSQPGWIAGETAGLSIIDAAWSPNGKALRVLLPAGFRIPLTNITQGTGAYAGQTILTGTGLGTAYNASVYKSVAGVMVGTLCVRGVDDPLGSTVFGVQTLNGQALGTGANDGGDTTYIDADNVAVRFDTTGAPSYTGGGYAAVFGGIGTGSIGPIAGNFSTLYNTNFYLRSLIRVHEDYKINLGAGAKMFFGIGQSGYQQFIYGANFLGVIGDNSDEDNPIMVAGDFSANGTAGGSFWIAAGATDLHPNPDYSTPGTSAITRGTPKDCEELFICDSEGNTDAVARMWFDQTGVASPDLERTGFQFCAGPTGTEQGYGPRGLTLFSLDNVFGGGGEIPDVDVIVDFAYIYVSGGYARTGEQPDHWELTVDNATPAVDDTVHVVGTLVDANGDRINSAISGSGFNTIDIADDDGVKDMQFSTDNGATWSVTSGSWDTFDTKGQIGLDVHITASGVTTINFRDIARALNNSRYGSWRTGAITVTAS